MYFPFSPIDDLGTSDYANIDANPNEHLKLFRVFFRGRYFSEKNVGLVFVPFHIAVFKRDNY